MSYALRFTNIPGAGTRHFATYAEAFTAGEASGFAFTVTDLDEQPSRFRFGIRAHRTARSQFGAATAWAKGQDGAPVRFETFDEAQTKAQEWNRSTGSAAVYYTAAEFSAMDFADVEGR